MWDNNLDLDRPQMTIRHMSVACWLPKPTNTHSEYVIIIAFPLQQWLLEHASMLCCMYTVLLTFQVEGLPRADCFDSCTACIVILHHSNFGHLVGRLSITVE